MQVIDRNIQFPISNYKNIIFIIQGRRIQAGVAEGGGVNMLWVGVEGYNFPADRIKHQLVEEGVVGFDEALDVLLRHH